MICDDAERGDAKCSTAALILLGALVKIGIVENDLYVVETLNRINFIGVLVDSLRSVLRSWFEAIQAGTSRGRAPTPFHEHSADHFHTANVEQELFWGAKLAVLLSLCQTREGAKFVIQNNLFRAIEVSGLFQTDPDLDIGMYFHSTTPLVYTKTLTLTQLLPTDQGETLALEKLYSLLLRVTRIIGAAVLARGSQSTTTQGPARRFLTDHRMLIVHVLKKSAGIGQSAVKASAKLEENVEDLAEAFMVLITTTGFLEVSHACEIVFSLSCNTGKHTRRTY